MRSGSPYHRRKPDDHPLLFDLIKNFVDTNFESFLIWAIHLLPALVCRHQPACRSNLPLSRIHMSTLQVFWKDYLKWFNACWVTTSDYIQGLVSRMNCRQQTTLLISDVISFVNVRCCRSIQQMLDYLWTKNNVTKENHNQLTGIFIEICKVIECGGCWIVGWWRGWRCFRGRILSRIGGIQIRLLHKFQRWCVTIVSMFVWMCGTSVKRVW